MSRLTPYWVVSLLLAGACSQYRAIPPSEATKLSAEHRSEAQPVVVRDVQGKRVRIDHFESLKVTGTNCVVLPDEQHDLAEPCESNRLRFYAPVGLTASAQTLWVRPQPPDRYHPRQVELTGVREVLVIDRSATRALVVTGVTLAAGIGAFFGTALLVNEIDDHDPHGYSALFLGSAAAGAAVGGSLAITLPLTRDLGVELPP